jgi:hypothetical protein
MDAFLLRLLHQNMQYVLLFLYLLQVAFVYRIYRMRETKQCIVSRACVLASQRERRSDLGIRVRQERGRSM